MRMSKEEKAMKGILLDGDDYSKLEEDTIRKYYGDEAYDRMKAEEETEKNMSRRQRMKKKAMQGRKSRFNVPGQIRFLRKGEELVELDNGRFKLVCRDLDQITEEIKMENMKPAPTSLLHLGDLLDDPEFRNSSPLTFPLGEDASGAKVFCDIADMPHLLITGHNGSEMGACINTILCSILCNAVPEEVRFVLIDPNVDNLSKWNGIPHLMTPVITEEKAAVNFLRWANEEIKRRFGLLSDSGVRQIDEYNQLVKVKNERTLPKVLIIINGFERFMCSAGRDLVDQISILTAKGRIVGVHLIVAAQRIDDDVLTPLIQACLPSKIVFAVANETESSVIHVPLAEKLAGNGDMFYYPRNAPVPRRVQGAFVSDQDCEKVVRFLSEGAIDIICPDDKDKQ